ncbi:hypothetical protein GCM10009554_39640 [Kribbella koreensis]|uniref:DUF3592 domain-containing protein n=2 Tax=Kribbella TaxID=182639 RepID=A0ABP6X225_9ACTN
MQSSWTPADPATRPAPLWVMLLPLIIGGLFVGYLGVSSVVDTYHLQVRGVSVTTDLVTVTDPVGKGSTRVDVWFKTADGHLAEARLERYRNVESHQEIQVEYDPEHPENAQQLGMGYAYRYLGSVGLLLLSALTLWGTGFLIVSSRRRYGRWR